MLETVALAPEVTSAETVTSDEAAGDVRDGAGVAASDETAVSEGVEDDTATGDESEPSDETAPASDEAEPAEPADDEPADLSGAAEVATEPETLDDPPTGETPTAVLVDETTVVLDDGVTVETVELTEAAGLFDDGSDADIAETDDDFAEEAPSGETVTQRTVVAIEAVTKEFGVTRAVDAVTLDITAGSFYGLVGPNGAGKTTLLSMVTGMLRPDAGRIIVGGHDVWDDPDAAKRVLGVLPDRLRLFDRLTGRQFLYYSGTLRGLDRDTVRTRSAELASAFGLEDALGRLVSDYSAGMTKKVAIAAAMIHSPRILVLDEPFEGVDPVSAQTVIDILQRFVASGGTVLLSSHSMETLERVCTGVAVIVRGELLAHGTVEDVSAQGSLEERFLELAGEENPVESMEWLLSSSG